jgi:UDP-glucose 4-epimerase
VSTILVTGGAGFIGSHVVDAYLQRGHRVVVLDDLSSGNKSNLDPRAELIEGDLRDGELLRSVFDRGIDVVNHHAAQISVRISVDDPAHDADVNVTGSLRLIEQANKSGVKRVIFASSGGALYGEAEGPAPSSEEDRVAPVSPYGCAKLAIEQYLHYYRVVHGLSSVALRYANVYGPRQNSLGEAGVVAIFSERLLSGEPLLVNGSGEQTRDFVFVEDVVRANVAALEQPLEGPYNVGTGVETNVLGIVAALERVSGRKGEVKHREAKKGEQQRSVLDAAKLRREGGVPEPAPFDEGLRKTWRWFADAQK